jgi:phosphoglycolate phosphatase-like HAD superfamily hydrolase
MIKNLIWDIDGTLFNTYPALTEAFLRALRSFGKQGSPDEVKALARIGLSQCSAELARKYDLPEEELGSKFGEIYSSIPKSVQVPFVDVREVCEYITGAGGINAIVTHRGRDSTLELLTTHGLEHLFPEILAGDEGFPKKPHPAAFLAVIQRCKLDPRESAAVGDRDIDILAGKEARLRTCLFRGEASTAQPDFAFSEYADLLRYLKAG